MNRLYQFRHGNPLFGARYIAPRAALPKGPARTLTRRLAGALAATASALALALVPGALTSAASAACSDPVGVSGDIPALNFHQRNSPVSSGTGLHMTTQGQVDRNDGGVSATTQTSNTSWGIGYTGGVLVVLKNGCGDPIGITQPLKVGVAAEGEFWSVSDRRDFWAQPMPDAITERTVSVEVIHSRVAHDRTLIAKYNQLQPTICRAWDAIARPAPMACPFPVL